MIWRVRRSIKIAPGIRINLNKKSTSVRIGPRGLGHTISSTGKRTTTVGIPGSGLSYSETTTPKKRRAASDMEKLAIIADGTPPPSKPKPSIFQGILTVAFLLFGVSFCASQFDTSADKSTDSNATVAQSAADPEKPLGLIQAPANASTPDAISVRGDNSPKATEVMFAKSRANMRTMPGTASKIVKTIDIGTSVTVLDRRDGWVNVSHMTEVGWIVERLLSVQRPASTARNAQPSRTVTRAPASNLVRPSAPKRSNNGYQRGPRGGCYYYTASGNKQYVDRSLCN